MATQHYQIAIIGGGIIGLATAMRLRERYPKCRVVVIEKEDELATHQTGHNSGVIHSGAYYKPGSQKARFCVDGVRLITKFCQENGIQYEECGKVIVTTSPSQLDRLEGLCQRGLANGVEGLEMIGPERLREIEPHAYGLKALYAPKTGIVDYKKVANAYSARIRALGGEVITGAKVMRIHVLQGSLVLETSQGPLRARHLINCAGLFADKVAQMMGLRPAVRIVPFRGEYYTIRPEKRHLVQGLIYPVPDPHFPFLGVHFTRTIYGEVEAGPNAVLAFARQGYKKSSFNLPELLDTLTYRGFWVMTRRFWRVGISEIHRSLSKRAFVRDLQRLVPEIQSEDVTPGGAGVRAQALGRDGALVDDFSIQETPDAIHVLNAPSPGATASLSIGNHIVDLAARSFQLS